MSDLRRLIVVRHLGPEDGPTPDNFAFEEFAAPGPLSDGSVRLRLTHLSIDPWYIGLIKPGMYSWCSPISAGQVFTGNAIARVTESKNPGFEVGDVVMGFLPFQTECDHDGGGLNKLGDTPPAEAMSVFGGPAITAFFGLEDVGKPTAGDVVVVSAAAGSVGSIVGQLCKERGCKVIGFAGGEVKCNMLTGELNFDSAIDYKGCADLSDQLRSALGDARVNVFWDNTGGPVADAVYDHMADHGRVVVCGSISSYVPGGPKGDLEHRNHVILERRLRVEGILVSEYFPRMGDAMPTLMKLHAAGKLHARAHIVRGFQNTIDAFLGLFTGQNTGKTLVEL